MFCTRVQCMLIYIYMVTETDFKGIVNAKESVQSTLLRYKSKKEYQKHKKSAQKNTSSNRVGQQTELNNGEEQVVQVFIAF